MTFRANSLAARDVASLVHPQTNLKLHEAIGPSVIRSGSGARVYDDDGNEFIDTVGGLWCAALGHSKSAKPNVRFWLKADIGEPRRNVRYAPNRCYEAEGSGFKLLRLFHRR